jgi:predicted ATPase
MVRQISFKNFKVFKNLQTLRLAPITVLIGKNNTGKSAVLRLPTMLASALKGEPLNWINKIGDDRENSIELGSDFKDLVYNKLEAGIIELGVFNENTSIEIAFNKEYGILDYKLNGENIDSNSSFKGLLIQGKPFGNLSLNIDYLGAIRVEPESSYTFSNDNYDKIGIRGQNAYSILVQDLKSKKTLINKVSGWYKKNFENWKLEILESVTRTETKYEIAISNSKIEAINIKQTGQGIHQVLPLIVRSYMTEDAPTLIIIEEPETHLHPAAHALLAQRFAESYLVDTNKQYLIETHSQNFILRLRRMVAEGTLKPEDIAIYYVDFDEGKNESSLTEIDVDNNGDVEWWPSGIFNESLNEVIELRKAQDSR